MKRLLTIIIASCFLFACRTTKVTTPAPGATSKTLADTALQGDKMKDATKP